MQTIWDKAGTFVIGLIARWSFKILSGILIGFGIDSGQWELYIGAFLTFIVGAIISKTQNDYLLKKEPPK